MDIEERQLKELAWLYFYFVKQGKKGTVDALTLFCQLKKAGIEVDENELVSDLEDLRDEKYIEMREKKGQGDVDIRVMNITLQGKRIIKNPFSANTSNDVMNIININSIQGNNNISSQSNTLNNTLNISDTKIDEIERQIDKMHWIRSMSIMIKKKKLYGTTQSLWIKGRTGIRKGVPYI